MTLEEKMELLGVEDEDLAEELYELGARDEVINISDDNLMQQWIHEELFSISRIEAADIEDNDGISDIASKVIKRLHDEKTEDDDGNEIPAVFKTKNFGDEYAVLSVFKEVLSDEASEAVLKCQEGYLDAELGIENMDDFDEFDEEGLDFDELDDMDFESLDDEDLEGDDIEVDDDFWGEID